MDCAISSIRAYAGDRDQERRMSFVPAGSGMHREKGAGWRLTANVARERRRGYLWEGSRLALSGAARSRRFSIYRTFES
jgi:hypothetical protein